MAQSEYSDVLALLLFDRSQEETKISATVVLRSAVLASPEFRGKWNSELTSLRIVDGKRNAFFFYRMGLDSP